MNEQHQTAFTFLDNLGVSSGFKIKTKNHKTTLSVLIDSSVDFEVVVKSLSVTMKDHKTVTIHSVDFSDPKVFTVTFTCKT